MTRILNSILDLKRANEEKPNVFSLSRQVQDRMREAFQQVSFEGEDRQVCTRLSMLKQAMR